MTNDVTITVGGAVLGGWTETRVTRRMEGCPNDFEVSLTERYPGHPSAFLIQAGDPCVVKIGSDTVITGYVDRYMRSYDKGAHVVSISGRGKTQDLIDCSAEWPNGQIVGSNVAEIATKLGAPYGINVVAVGENQGPAIPQFNLTIGETAFDIIERICRYAGLLCYEDQYGDLVLANGSDIDAASGFVEGVNVQSARVVSSMDQRYSQIQCFTLSMNLLGDIGGGNAPLVTATDPNVPRHRLLFQIAEAGGAGIDVTKARALWEVSRRAARGFEAHVVADSWRDVEGGLWTPNTLAHLDLPGLKRDAVRWLIGEVTYRKAPGSGTTVDVVMMDPAAFTLQPILLQPVFADVVPAKP